MIGQLRNVLITLQIVFLFHWVRNIFGYAIRNLNTYTINNFLIQRQICSWHMKV